MSEIVDRTEIVARRLARHDGLDPDALGLPTGWQTWRGTYASQLPSNLRRVWQIYVPVAEAALEAVDQFAADMKRFAAEQERAEQERAGRAEIHRSWNALPNGGSPGLGVGTLVDVQFRDDRISYRTPSDLLYWGHRDHPWDIVAWRLSGVQPAVTESQWTPWNGSKFPPNLPAEAFVDVQLRDGRTKTHRPFEYMSWWQDGSSVDIIAWRLSADQSPQDPASTAASR